MVCANLTRVTHTLRLHLMLNILGLTKLLTLVWYKRRTSVRIILFGFPNTAACLLSHCIISSVPVFFVEYNHTRLEKLSTTTKIWLYFLCVAFIGPTLSRWYVTKGLSFFYISFLMTSLSLQYYTLHTMTRVSGGNRTHDPHANSLDHYPLDYPVTLNFLSFVAFLCFYLCCNHFFFRFIIICFLFFKSFAIL